MPVWFYLGPRRQDSSATVTAVCNLKANPGLLRTGVQRIKLLEKIDRGLGLGGGKIIVIRTSLELKLSANLAPTSNLADRLCF